MPAWKENDKVRLKTRPVTEDDRKDGTYYEHMAGLIGTIANCYADDLFAIQIEKESLSEITRQVHEDASERMRQDFVSKTPEEQRKQLSDEEVNFKPHFVLLAHGKDLEKA